MAMRIQQYRGDAAAFQDVRATDAFAPAQAVVRQVQAAMAGGKAFDEAVRTISAAPVLPPPGVAADRKSLLDSLNGLPPSTVSAVFALITDVANRQRQANAEQRFLTSEKQVDEMLGQARDIRSKAVSELVFGMVNGAVSVASGAASAAVSLKGMGEANQMSERASARLAEAEALPGGAGQIPAAVQAAGPAPGGLPAPAAEGVANAEQMAANAARNVQGPQAPVAAAAPAGPSTAVVSANNASLAAQNAMMRVNIKANLLNQISGGAQSGISGVGRGVTGMYDEEIKRKDAQTEKMRALNEALSNSEEALKQLIQKVLQTADTIQQTTNQARQKILG